MYENCDIKPEFRLNASILTPYLSQSHQRLFGAFARLHF
jgi:hypothetical protein